MQQNLPNIVIMRDREVSAERQKLTVAKAQQILLDEGLEISLEETEKVLDFLRKLAILIVNHHLRKHENSRFVRKGQH